MNRDRVVDQNIMKPTPVIHDTFQLQSGKHSRRYSQRLGFFQYGVKAHILASNRRGLPIDIGSFGVISQFTLHVVMDISIVIAVVFPVGIIMGFPILL